MFCNNFCFIIDCLLILDNVSILIDITILLSVGIALAMFGGGGAVILIPYLTRIAGYPLDEAVLMSLLTIGINTGNKTIRERKSIDWKAVLAFSVLAFPTAAASGSYLAPIVSDAVRMTVFGAFTLTVATLMLFPINQNAFSRKNPLALAISALLTGVICGLIGVGGRAIAKMRQSTGVFLAGAGTSPKDIPEAVSQGSGAAGKVLSLFSRWAGQPAAD